MATKTRPRETKRERAALPPGGPPRPPRRRVHWLRLIAVGFLLTLVSVTALLFGFITAIAQDLPSLEQFTYRQPQQIGHIWARGAGGKWVRIATLRSPEARRIVGPDQIAQVMKQAIVSIEDRRFYEHRGFDPEGIVRAATTRVLTGTMQGGSTLTQQLIKNTYLSPEVTVKRKVREIALAYQLEREWTKQSGSRLAAKDRIVTAYLNTAYYGNGAWGVSAAAKLYFNTTPDRLETADAALLAGVVQAPDPTYDPIKRPEAALARRNLVLDKMAEQGYITPAAAEIAKRSRLLPDVPHTLGGRVEDRRHPFLADYVIEQLKSRYGETETFGGGLEVYTSFDLALQARAERALRGRLRGTGLDGAMAVIEPKSGQVKAIVSSQDYFGKSDWAQYDLATLGRRPPGSTFKPYVFLTAMRRGIQPSSSFLSKRVVLRDGSKTGWLVRNDVPVYLGPTSLHKALAVSDNTVFARLTMLVKPTNVARTAHDLGIVSPLNPVPSIGLGSVAVTPLEMAHAYATILNSGERVGGSILFHSPDSGVTDPSVDPISIVKLTRPGEDGARESSGNRALRRSVVPEQHALSVLAAMRDVVTAGTGKRAAVPGQVIAGKTGTTSDFNDAWFVGGTPRLATAVWIGHAQNPRPMETEFGGEEVMGGTIPALVFSDFMTQALRGKPTEPWPFPGYVDAANVTVDSRDFTLTRRGCAYAQDVVLATNAIPTKESSSCSTRLTVTPNVIGEKRRSATDLAINAGLDFSWQTVPARPGQALGVVVDQEPRPGDSVPVLSRLVAFITVKRPTVVVPDVRSRRGRTVDLDTAVLRLRAAGFKAVVLDQEERPELPDLSVVAQEPRAKILAPYGSTVTLFVTGPADLVRVPRVARLTVGQARRVLRRIGLELVARRHGGKPSLDTDRVIGADITAGKRVPAGTPIAVVSEPGR